MSEVNVYFARHGHTALTGPPDRFCGSSDPGLTEQGRQEVERLAQSLAGQIAPTVVYSSDLLRARESAEILAGVLRVPRAVIADLREIDFGEWEGLTKAEAEARCPKLYARWLERPVDVVPPGGTGIEEAVSRVARFTRLVRSQGGSALFVAHKAFLRVALCTWLGIELASHRSSFAICPASLGCVVLGGAGSRLTLLNWSPTELPPEGTAE
jgi:broad specificity phosphatase PhoE